MRNSPAAAPSQYGWVSGVGFGTKPPAIGVLLRRTGVRARWLVPVRLIAEQRLLRSRY
jgi:hypothetical protein